MVAFILPLLPILALLERSSLDLSTTDVLQKMAFAPAKQQQMTSTSNWLASDNNSIYWNLPNGEVTFDKPLLINLEDKGATSVVRLSNPVFLGR
jgi:hypothetical protein